MKFISIATALSLGILTLTASAQDGHAHASSKHEHAESKEGHASAMGQPGVAARVARTIDVDMNDAMRFTPSHIAVKKGETVKFIVKNSGKIKHEMVLGSAQELQEHAKMMQKFPEMEHADANQISVDPGKSGQIIWTFSKAGTFDFACLEPGHFEAGMKGQVKVATQSMLD